VTRRRALKLLAWIGLPVAAIVAIVLLWNWDWFVPMVQARASADIGRPVSIQHLHVRLGRVTTVAVDGVAIANPPGWAPGPALAQVQQILVRVDLVRYLFHHQLVVPLVELTHPQLAATEIPTGQANWRLALPAGSGGGTHIGNLVIQDGQAQVRLQVPKLRADFVVEIETRQQPGMEPQLLAEAHGTYAGQPITARMIGGAILALRDVTHPWPIDLRIANGSTKVTLVGSVRDPMALAGADLRLHLAGPDMGRLEPLTGIPLPHTAPFQVTGRLDFAPHQVRFQDFAGTVGQSDLEGDISVEPGNPRDIMTADLHSRMVNLADLGGFIGAKAGAGPSPAAKASPTVLPTRKLHVPELHWADVHLRYSAARIEGRSMPLDNLAAALDIVNGEITLHPISFGVGPGRIAASVQLIPTGAEFRTNASIDFQSVDVARLMASTHMFHGAGTISGSGRIVTVGDSVAQMAANGNGEILLGMAGGNLSAMLVDLSGLEFGDALLAKLGVPTNAQVQCMVTDFALTHGVMQSRAMIIDTSEAIVSGKGWVDLRDEKLNLQLQTQPTHFTIGSLAGPINIGGTLKHPSIMPGAEMFIRGGLAVGLGILLAPLAILPTIQFGSSDHGACDQLLADARSAAPGTKPPAPQAAGPLTHRSSLPPAGRPRLTQSHPLP
jgi:AsmA family protein